MLFVFGTGGELLGFFVSSVGLGICQFVRGAVIFLVIALVFIGLVVV